MRYTTDTNFAQSTGPDKTQISPKRGDSSIRRAEETEADRMGIELAARAGYDPAAKRC